MEELKVGDRIRLTIEGAVEEIDSDGEVYISAPGADSLGFYPELLDKESASVEKITKPFGVGDVVRNIFSGNKYLLLEDQGEGGFVYLSFQYPHKGAATFCFEPASFEVVVSDYGRQAAA